MRQTTLIWIVLGLCGAQGSRAGGQELPGNSLIDRKSWTQFDLVLGRITARNPRYRQTNTVSDGSESHGVQESLSLQVNEGVPSMHYELKSAEIEVTIEVIDGNQVVIRQRPTDSTSDACRIEFHQPARGRLSLRVEDPSASGANASAADYSADNLWALLLAEPAVCDRYLIRLLSLMRPNWRLTRRVEQVRECLFRVARSGLFPDTAKLDELVERLGSPRFQDRQAADRELRSAGQAALSYLERLDTQALDGEQRRRIERIRRDLVGIREDTPERVAMWLIDEPEVWLTLTSSDTPTDREFAARRVATLNGRQD